MKKIVSSLCIGVALLAAPNFEGPTGSAAEARELAPYLQCVPYAREVSGIRIFGDAHTWWGQAKGRFARGNTPKVGAVMAFKPTNRMRLGHVAAVSQIIDSRTVLLDHANWSPINGRRGQIERGVKAIDVSKNNDWSRVRVWYHPLQGLGKTAWPVHGFIYGDGKVEQKPFERSVKPQPPVRVAVSNKPSQNFLQAFASVGKPSARTSLKPIARPTRTVRANVELPPIQRSTRVAQRSSAASDPFAAVLSKYDR